MENEISKLIEAYKNYWATEKLNEDDMETELLRILSNIGIEFSR